MPISRHLSKGGDGFPGLRTLVKSRLLKDVFDTASEKAPGWNILVVDSTSMSVISSTVGMYDIMERRITIVEALEKKRAPFPDKGVIYLLEPTAESIDKLLEDYESGKKVLYGPNVFLFFLARLPDPLLERIKHCRPLVKRVKALSEINIDFLAKEERAFTLAMRGSFAALYSRQGASPHEEKIAEKLVTVCATLNEYPHIRYSKASKVCDSIAQIFHKKMDTFVASNPSWWYHGGGKDPRGSTRDRGVLLLLDRADDCLTPLMHSFNYQPMVYDLLPMEGDRITYQAETQEDVTETSAKDVLLDEKDELWVELRGKHIAQVIEMLSGRIRDIMNSSTGSTLGKKSGDDGEGKMSLSDMAAALKALPEYREIMSKLSQHMHIAHECMDVFSSESLMDLSEIEQTLATGVDDEGRHPKMSEIIDRVELCLRKMKDSKTRLRLILIATMSPNGLNFDDRNRLLDAADFSRSDSQTVDNLKLMGARMGGHSDKKKKGGGGLFSGLTGSSDDEDEDDSEFAASRYKPFLSKILKQLLGAADEPLSFEDFPSVLPMPESSASSGTAASARRKKKHHGAVEGSARKGAGASKRWASTSANSKGKSSSTSFTGGRNIVFTVGGMSYSEMQVCRDIMAQESREIVFGSTAFVTAREFVDDLSTLS